MSSEEEIYLDILTIKYKSEKGHSPGLEVFMSDGGYAFTLSPIGLDRLTANFAKHSKTECLLVDLQSFYSDILPMPAKGPKSLDVKSTISFLCTSVGDDVILELIIDEDLDSKKRLYTGEFLSLYWGQRKDQELCLLDVRVKNEKV